MLVAPTPAGKLTGNASDVRPSGLMFSSNYGRSVSSVTQRANGREYPPSRVGWSTDSAHPDLRLAAMSFLPGLIGLDPKRASKGLIENHLDLCQGSGRAIGGIMKAVLALPFYCED
jgi:hypothetical protein